MTEQMKAIIRENDMCVLATSFENEPHCSLMRYVTDESVSTIYMVTLKTTRKYQNIARNPCISLLVDTRLNSPAAHGDIRALTLYGTVHPLEEEPARGAILGMIGKAHPDLRATTLHKEAEVLAVKIKSFLLLDGAFNVTRGRVE